MLEHNRVRQVPRRGSERSRMRRSLRPTCSCSHEHGDKHGKRKLPDDGRTLGDFLRLSRAGVAQQQPVMNPKPVPGVERVVAVASGKGGVGKSTIAANLAVALAQRGLRVGLMDADVHGPSLPILMGIPWDVRPDADEQNRIVPIFAHGVACVSVGLLVRPERAAVWRGPMVSSALDKMARGTAWKDRQVLIVDLPPGTGDAQLTLSQRVRIDGAVVVSTPQDVALADARRGVDMFGRVGVPVVGLVENMSHFQCANCGHEDHVFGHGGARMAANELGVPFLGEVPLRTDVRLASDRGMPIVLSDPTGSAATALRGIADKVAETLRLGQ